MKSSNVTIIILPYILHVLRLYVTEWLRNIMDKEKLLMKHLILTLILSLLC